MMIQDDVGMSELQALRLAELHDEENHARDCFETYWAGSASASVMHDYAAGRVSQVPARLLRRRV